jgi:hypothetical protein
LIVGTKVRVTHESAHGKVGEVRHAGPGDYFQVLVDGTLRFYKDEHVEPVEPYKCNCPDFVTATGALKR